MKCYIQGFAAKSFDYIGAEQHFLTQVLYGDIVSKSYSSENGGATNCSDVSSWISGSFTSEKDKTIIAVTYTNRSCYIHSYIVIYIHAFLYIF